MQLQQCIGYAAKGVSRDYSLWLSSFGGDLTSKQNFNCFRRVVCAGEAGLLNQDQLLTTSRYCRPYQHSLLSSPSARHRHLLAHYTGPGLAMVPVMLYKPSSMQPPVTALPSLVTESAAVHRQPGGDVLETRRSFARWHCAYALCHTELPMGTA